MLGIARYPSLAASMSLAVTFPTATFVEGRDECQYFGSSAGLRSASVTRLTSELPFFHRGWGEQKTPKEREELAVCVHEFGKLLEERSATPA